MAHTRNEAVTRHTDHQPTDHSDESNGDRHVPHRVDDEQGTGHGAATALSKLLMIERKKSEWRRNENPTGGQHP
jgi:hypothetical protein